MYSFLQRAGVQSLFLLDELERNMVLVSLHLMSLFKLLLHRPASSTLCPYGIVVIVLTG